MASDSEPASDAAMLTPSPRASVINNDSPWKSVTCAATTNITQLRSEIANEMNEEFVEADFDAFFAAYLPFVPNDTDVDKCFDRLCQTSGTNKQTLLTPMAAPKIKSEEVENKYAPTFCLHFAEQVKHPSGNTEKKVFAQLVPVAEAIGNSSISGRQQQYRFLDCPNTNITSDIGGSTNRIDACFVPHTYKEDEPLHTSKLAVACEWKLRENESDMISNNKQVLSANVQMTNCNVCRAYSFGITIDGCVMKLWYFSRSHSAVSEPVNYIENPKFLIKAFMSFMFATPQEMGFDDTITRHSSGNFTYTVSGRHFRTLKCLSELGSNNITGRMTRVWSVNEVESTAEHARLKSNHEYVLKDVWLEETALTEREIQTEIFNDIERFWNTTLTPTDDGDGFKDLFKMHEQLVTTGEYRKHFLTIETDATQQVTKKAVNKNQKLELFELAKGSRDTTSNTKKESKLRERVNTHVELESVYPVEPARRKENIERDFAPRKQYRVVFREMCETVGRLKTLGEVFDVVKDTLIPLQLMFCAGWVHRDISSGNILAYKPPNSSKWIAILSDLEYAKRFPPQAGVMPHKDPKTGTPYFMATEILQQQYLFYNSTVQTVNLHFKGLVVSNVEKAKSTRKLPPTPIIHNFQHDLESIWWLLLWSMTSRVNHKASQQYAKSIFENVLAVSRKRAWAFQFSIEDRLAETLIQPASTLLPDFMDTVRSLLYLCYKAREEQGLLFDHSSYISVHAIFQEYFEELYKEEDRSWRAIELQLPSREVHNDKAEPSAPVMIQQPSTSRPQEDECTRGLGDVHRSTAGSSRRVERRESLRKGKRRESPSDDKQSGPGPSAASEEERPFKRLRRSTRNK